MNLVFPGGPFDLMSRRMVSANNKTIAERIIKEIEIFPAERDDVVKKWVYIQIIFQQQLDIVYVVYVFTFIMYFNSKYCPVPVIKGLYPNISQLKK